MHHLVTFVYPVDSEAVYTHRIRKQFLHATLRVTNPWATSALSTTSIIAWTPFSVHIRPEVL